MKHQYKEMGQRIRLRRKELLIKQSDLAEKISISNNHMSAIENGREKPSLDIFLLICEELRVTPDYLLLGNMHANDVPQNIADALRLCHEKDVELTRQFVEILVKRNQS